MKTYSESDLKEIIRKHGMWLRGEDGGQRADLGGANLGEADLRGANLRWADLRGANLREANLRGADLRGADLREANLRGADLGGADLRWADLRWADLRGANLRGAINGHVCRMDFGGWSICIYEARTSIGCKTRDNAAWLSWTHKSPEIIEMHSQASEWWRVHGDAVKAAIRCVMAKAESERQAKEGDE